MLITAGMGAQQIFNVFSLFFEVQTVILVGTNILEFDKYFWIQLIGTAMGAPSAPTYANISRFF